MSSGNNLQDIGSLILVTLYAVYYFQMLRHEQTSGISSHAYECLCINQTINYVLSNN